MPIKNTKLWNAKIAKKDEFYTQLSDIEDELRHYKEHFRWKTVLCNCDDPRISNFFHYFAYNFEHLWLKRLITTCYKNQNPDLFTLNESEKAVYLIYDGDKNWNNIPDMNEIWINNLKWDWDFRSEECIELLKQADIVVTNPPFSLFKEYFQQLIKYEKKFLIMWNHNALHYTEIFPLIMENKVWLWYNSNKTIRFALPDYYDKYEEIIDWVKYWKVPSIAWYTNLEIQKRHEPIILYKKYNEEDYPKYDNFDAINVERVSDIPCDYYWTMWVPDTFLDIYNPDEFEILWADCIPEYAEKLWIDRIWEDRIAHYRANWWTWHYTANMRSLVITIKWKPKKVYSRILIRRKK